MIKKISAVFLILSILWINVFAMPLPTKEFYINDFADVIDSDVEKHVYNMSALIEKETGAQIVVVTVESLDGMADTDYALKLGRKWGIGDSEKDNGFLMLISTEDRALRFEVGYGLEGALPDGKCGRIQDQYMIPYLSEDNYSQAVLKGYDRIIAEVCKEYGIDIPKEVDAVPLPEEDEANTAEVIAFLVILILILIFYFKTPPSRRRTIFFFGGYGGSRGSFSGGGFSGGGGSFGGGGSSRRF